MTRRLKVEVSRRLLVAPPLQSNPIQVQNINCCEATKKEISVVMMLVMLGGFFMAMGAISGDKRTYTGVTVHRIVCLKQIAEHVEENGEDGQIFVLDLPITNQHVYPPLPHPNARENRVHLAPARSSNNG
ncbi:hypothetical protein CVT24_011547 [Panaeolus cyanescens]|uniref:Uncharacterized protein n=1 Tax=Panaeolus cyanescens TaxID=181874 RepID=A0A409YV10_9AGAR|nr:hypothetical protein CVT24_011547 [Panaeolus cyanescens]